MSEIEIDRRVTRLETQHEAHRDECAREFHALNSRIADEIATRHWVRDEIRGEMKPIVDAQVKMAATQEKTSRQIEELTATQNEAMKQRMQQERDESAARIAALERSSFRYVVRRGWFWVWTALGLPPILLGSIEAIKRLHDFLT